MTKWNWVALYPQRLSLGQCVDIGAFTLLACQAGITLGNYIQIGSHCSLYSKSTIDNKEGEIIIHNNARIGSHSTIMPGVTIGEGAIIGAHSFVNKDVPVGETWFGVPARKNQPRGLDEVVLSLEKKNKTKCAHLKNLASPYAQICHDCGKII